LLVGQGFLRYGVVVAAELFGAREAVEGRVGRRFEEPLVGCYVAGDCAVLLEGSGIRDMGMFIRKMSFWRLLKGILKGVCQDKGV